MPSMANLDITLLHYNMYTHAQTYSVLWYRYSVHRYWLPRQVWDKPLCGQNDGNSDPTDKHKSPLRE